MTILLAFAIQQHREATYNVERTEGSFIVKSGLAQMCKGGLIMDVVNAEQARIAEEAGVNIF